MAHENEMTVIGRDTKIKGEMSFDSGARILGIFEGKIDSAGEIQIGAGAQCNATIEAERVIVDGTVNGDIQAKDIMTLNSEAMVTGDIVATKLVVLEGAAFEGNCRVGSSPKSSSSTASKRSTTSSTLKGKSSSEPVQTVVEPKGTAATSAGLVTETVEDLDTASESDTPAGLVA